MYNHLNELEAPILQGIVDRALAGETPVVGDGDVEQLLAEYGRTRTPVSAGIAASSFNGFQPDQVLGALRQTIVPDTISDIAITQSNPDCIVAEGNLDTSGRLANGEQERYWIVLRRPDDGAQNPTGWLIDGRVKVEESPEPQCFG